MKTLEEKIAVMQWALENPEKELGYNGVYVSVKGASWDWYNYDYSIPIKYQIAPGHNPDKLTVEQVGEGWRLLTKGEIEERARVMVLTEDIDCWQCDNKWFYGRENYEGYDDDNGFYGHLLTCTFRTQKPEGYFLPKEPTYRDWTIAEVPLGWWFKNKYSGVIETIERCYPDNNQPFTLSGGNESPAGLREHWLCTSSNTPLAPDTVWSVCGVEV